MPLHPAPAALPSPTPGRALPQQAVRAARPAAALVLALVGSACIVLPRTAQVYDAACRTYVKQVILETTEVGPIGGCVNEGCAVLLASMGIVSAASAVVSGSVAVVGNIVYWLERKGQCPAPTTPGQAPPPLLKEDTRP